MKRLLILALLLAMPLLAQAGNVYKYVDDKGIVHYTDKPPAGAKKADLPPLQTYSSQPSDAAGATTPPPAAMPMLPPEAAALGFYSGVKIISPAPDETYHTADAVVSAVASVQPVLQSNQGHHVVFYLDGMARPAEGGGTSLTLSGIDRGTHTLTAAVLDSAGQSLIQSDPVSFHLLPPTVSRNKR